MEEAEALRDSVTISCSGFSPSGEELTFFFWASSDLTEGRDLSLGEADGADAAELTTTLPVGEPLNIRVEACNSYDACAEVEVEGGVHSRMGEIDNDFIM